MFLAKALRSGCSREHFDETQYSSYCKEFEDFIKEKHPIPGATTVEDSVLLVCEEEEVLHKKWLEQESKVKRATRSGGKKNKLSENESFRAAQFKAPPDFKSARQAGTAERQEKARAKKIQQLRQQIHQKQDRAHIAGVQQMEQEETQQTHDSVDARKEDDSLIDSMEQLVNESLNEGTMLLSETSNHSNLVGKDDEMSGGRD
jgi:predicted ATP-binding protein involved in virulence